MTNSGRGTGPNLLINGDFESGATNWNVINGQSEVVNTNAYSGTRCLRFLPGVNDITGYTGRIVQREIYLEYGVSYILSFFAKRFGKKILRVSFNYRGLGGGYYTLYYPSLLEHTSQTYSMQTAKFTLPAEATDNKIQITIYASDGSDGTSEAYIDDIQLRSFTRDDDGPADRGTGDNLLVNGNFDTTGGWEFFNGARSSSNGCFDGNRGFWCSFGASSNNRQYASQSLEILRGTPYTLSLRAKRIGAADLWAHYTYMDSVGAVKQVSLPSLLNSTYELFTLHTFSLTIPADASSDQITLTLNAGENTGSYAIGYIDDVQFRGSTPIPPQPQASYGMVANVPSGQTVTVRHAADTSSGYLGHWKNGAKFAILSVQGDGVRVRWGKDWNANTHAPTEDGWINNGFVETVTMPTLFVDRYVDMALSFAGHQGSAWGYNDDNSWCQSFINNMAISAGLQSVESKILINSNTWDCYTWLMQNGAYTSENLENCEIRKGDWIYYQYNTTDNTSHVGIITDVDGRMIKTIAGNVIVSSTQPHIVGTQDWFDISDPAYKVRGIARPNW